MLIFLLIIATAFIGYVLPWGQISFWGATVITNLFSAIPLVGQPFVEWVWGGFSVDNPTLNRFFSLHYVLPFVILALVVVHLVLLFACLLRIVRNTFEHSGLQVLATPLPEGRTGLIWWQMMHSAIFGMLLV